MHIFIDTYGVMIDVDNDMLRFTNGDEKRVISVKKVKSLHCFKPATLTSTAMVLASSHEIPIIFYNNYGKVEAWVWSHKYGNIADIRINQASYSVSDQRIVWIKGVLKQKFANQGNNLEWLKGRKQKHAEAILIAIEKINIYITEFDNKCQSVGTVRSYEGLISKLYWEVIFASMEVHTDASKRIKRGADDTFNSALNYLYGILYGQVEVSLLMHGLDPYIGLLHINRHDKPSLAFDHIEPYRSWADKLLLEMLIKGWGTADDYEEDEAGELRISKIGRKKLIEGFFVMIEERSYLNGKRIRKKDHIHTLSNDLVRELKKFRRT